MKNKTVYEIIFDYSTEDCSGIDTYIFSTKEKAVKKLEELITSEKEFYKTEYSYINEKDFEIDTNFGDRDAFEYWWNIQYKNDWYLHTNIDLRIKEIN